MCKVHTKINFLVYIVVNQLRYVREDLLEVHALLSFHTIRITLATYHPQEGKVHASLHDTNKEVAVIRASLLADGKLYR